MNMKKLLITVGLGFWMSAASAATAANSGDIVETLGKQGEFKTLAAALSATDLVSTLESNGPFTVLAPTDAAFAKLGQGNVDKLLADPALLKSILLYHVVPGKVSLINALRAGKAATVNGAEVRFTFNNRGFFVNDARIKRPNVQASNGIIHVIDSVLMPPAPQLKDIVAIASGDARFQTLVTALKAADLVSTLQGPGPFTVFAPTNEAFAKLGTDALNAVLADKEKLSNILLYHVIPGAAVDFAAASKLMEAEAANGEELKISFVDGVLRINDSQVIVKDIKASNGIIHVIDTVLMP